MASLFGARRRRPTEDDGEDDRSGNGRYQRRRLSPEEEDAASPEEEAGPSPGWLSGFVSGAKKVFSSVLLFSSPEEPTSVDEDEEDYDSEGGDDLSPNENEDVHNNIGAIVPYSESKLAIKEMVMKENFSRDEFDKMVELLKTRVTDSELSERREFGTPKEIPSRNMGTGHDFSGAWRSLNRDRNFSESVPFSSMRSGSFSPGSSLQTSPELCTAAVKEAKKWLEEKRKGMGLKPEDNGPCTLNTDMFSSGFDSDMGSPVDLAKSYMRSLPPWQSPFLSGQRFNTSSSGVTMKEDYLSNFWMNFEESQRARKGSFGGSADGSKFRHYGSTSRLFENDTSLFSSGPAQFDHGSDKIEATEPVSGCPIPIKSSEDGNDAIVEPSKPATDTGSAPQEYHAAPEVHPDKAAEGNSKSGTSVAKDATVHSGDSKDPIAEPQNGESQMNSASVCPLPPKCYPGHQDPWPPAVSHSYAWCSISGVILLRPKDAGPPIQIGMNGSANKTSANGLLDRSKANCGIESSGNDNPSCTNSSSAVSPISEDLTESAADAADVVSVENGTGMNPELEEPSKGSKQSYVRRGRKRVARGTRGRGK